MNADAYLTDVRRSFHKIRELADGAVAQLDHEQLFTTLGDDENSVAIVMQHMAGNMRSRWTDFLTSDGEKPDRARDTEFVVDRHDERALFETWEGGWKMLFATVDRLTIDDLDRTIEIRGEPLSVVEALQRQIGHYSYHTGQIVFLARHFCGPQWCSLSIPRGKSDEFNAAPRRYIDAP